MGIPRSMEHTPQLPIHILKGEAGVSPQWPKMSHGSHKMQELMDFNRHVPFPCIDHSKLSSDAQTKSCVDLASTSGREQTVQYFCTAHT